MRRKKRRGPRQRADSRRLDTKICGEGGFGEGGALGIAGEKAWRYRGFQGRSKPPSDQDGSF